MTTKMLDSISEQIAAARKSVDERPEWMKCIAHFSEPSIESKITKKPQSSEFLQENRKKP